MAKVSLALSVIYRHITRLARAACTRVVSGAAGKNKKTKKKGRCKCGAALCACAHALCVSAPIGQFSHCCFFFWRCEEGKGGAGGVQ